MRLSYLVCFAFLLVASTHSARADETTSATSLASGTNHELPSPVPPPSPRSVPMRTTGQVLTILGVGQIIAGSVVTAVWQYKVDHHGALDGGCGACFPPYPNFVGPAVLASGFLSAAAGVPLWIVGAHHMRAEEGSAARVEVGPARLGFALDF